MKNRYFSTIGAIAIAFFVLVLGVGGPLVSGLVYAGGDTGTTPDNIVRLPNPVTAKTFEEFITRLLDVLIIFGLPLFGLMVALAAVYFITAGDSPQRRNTAKNILKYAIIGFVLLVSSRALVLLVSGFL